MQSKLVSGIARRLVMKLLRRPSLAVVSSFSGAPMQMSVAGLTPAPDGYRPMVRVTPKSLYTYDGAAGRELVLSLDIRLDCGSPEFLADSELKAMIERYMNDPADRESGVFRDQRAPVDASA